MTSANSPERNPDAASAADPTRAAAESDPAGVDLTGRLPGFDEVEHLGWHHFQDAGFRLYESVNRALTRRHRLTLVDVQLLEHLRHRGPSCMGDLADVLMVVPSRLTQQAVRLELRGLIARHASTIDGRRVMAVLTREGDAQLHAALNTYGRLVRGLFLNQLTRQEITAVGDSCRRIGDALLAVNPSAKLPRM